MDTDKQIEKEQIEKDFDYAFNRDDKCPICKFKFAWEYFNNNNMEAENGREIIDCPGCGFLLTSFKLKNGDIQIWREDDII